MAYAIFRDGAKLSRAFPTREEVLRKANEAGLMDEADGALALEDNLTISPCPPDPETGSEDDLDWTLDQDQAGNQKKASQ